ncbi:MAG: hypothetical protein LQ341_000625 [Variospora aurantia]|nr:MAG: hypothetical protein LQ341_000625 [Variospora aurantia]
MSVSQAKVKSVLSGDTLILVSVNNPNQERLLSLAFVSAPRYQRDREEPFAFHSRDFLRKLTVGKVIQFHVLYSIPTGTKKDYGTVILQGGEQLPEAAVAEGWAKVRDDSRRKDLSDESESLLSSLELQENKAKTDGRGIWAGQGGIIETSHDLPDPKTFLETYSSKSLDAIVERVLTGDRMVLRLALSPSKHLQTIITVAGIRAPRRANTAEGKEQAAEPLANESHQFVESRLLQRSVKVSIIGLTPQNQLICVVKHPNGSIADFLLKAGLAKCADFHSTLLGAEMKTLRQAEQYAKDNRLGLHKGHVESKVPGGNEIDATVARIVRPDTLTLRLKSGSEKTVQLSSIRGPKPKDEKQGPFDAEAKEFLRKKLIGKHVRATTDGVKPPSEGYEEREVVTIMANNKNVALMLVESGYASVVRHRKDDSDRSPYYDELLAAEEAAQSGQKGMWSPKSPAAKTYQDYSESLQKAKIQSSVLQRQKKVPAVVDYVKSASRFTVLIPRENAKLTFVLSGIRAPRSARNPTEKAEPFGQEAHDFANRRCLQRDVEIDVETTDKQGGFIGVLFVNRENFAKLLLEEGYATVHAYSAEQSGHANELFAAEEKAKEGRKGIWHDYDPAAEEQDGEAPSSAPSAALLSTTDGASTNGTSTTPASKDYRDVLITHIDPETCALKIQHISPTASHALTSLMAAFRTFHLSPSTSSSSSSSSSTPPKTGEVVAAKFSEDKEWYRARVRRNDRDAKTSEVLFIDYGNSEAVAWKDIRPLGPVDRFGTGKLKAQAADAHLSFCQFPTTNREYMADAVAFLRESVEGKQVVARVDFVEKGSVGAGAGAGSEGALWVTVFDPNGGGEGQEVNVNQEVVAEGLAMAPRKLKAWEQGQGPTTVKTFREKEEEAKGARRGMWEYGDLTED